MMTWEKMKAIQPVASKIFMNSLQQNRMSHAYIIHGFSNSVKDELIDLLAMSLFCVDKEGIEPCQQCQNCKRIISKNYPDIYRLERETQSIGTDQIAHFIRELSMTAYESDDKIFIVPDAENLTVQAANRLLKFIEEPHEGTTIILLTDNVNSLLPTIQSRCQMIDLQPLSVNHMQDQLVQHEINEIDARLISALTNSVEAGITLHEDRQIYEIRDVIKDLLEVVMKRHDERFLFLHQVILTKLKERGELDMGLDIMLLAVQDMTSLQIKQKHHPNFFIENDVLAQQSINYFSGEKLMKMMNSIIEAKRKLKQNINPTLVMEDFVLQL